MVSWSDKFTSNTTAGRSIEADGLASLVEGINKSTRFGITSYALEDAKLEMTTVIEENAPVEASFLRNASADLLQIQTQIASLISRHQDLATFEAIDPDTGKKEKLSCEKLLVLAQSLNNEIATVDRSLVFDRARENSYSQVRG